MSLRTASRLLLGFVLGIAAGWLAGLLRPLPQAPDTSSAAGTNLSLIGISSQANVRVGSETRQAPIESMLYSPGMGPAVSTSMEMKTSLLLVVTQSVPPL